MGQLHPGSFSNVQRKWGKTFLADLSHRMKHEYITMILKLKSSRCTGSITLHHQRILLCSPQQERWCSQSFEISIEVVMIDFLEKGITVNKSAYVMPLMSVQRGSKSMLLCYRNCGMSSMKKDEACWQKKSASSKTTLQFTMLMLSRWKHSPEVMKSFVIPLTLPTRHHLTSTSFWLLNFFEEKHFLNEEELTSEVKFWFQMQPTDFYRRGIHSSIKCVIVGSGFIEKD